MSCNALTRVTSTPNFDNSSEPSAAASVNVAGSATAPHQRAGVGSLAFWDLDNGGFPGERGLIHQQRAVAHPHVGGHDGALAQMNQVLGHHFLRADGVLLAVAAHTSLDAELLPQQRQHLLGFALLQETKHRWVTIEGPYIIRALVRRIPMIIEEPRGRNPRTLVLRPGKHISGLDQRNRLTI